MDGEWDAGGGAVLGFKPGLTRDYGWSFLNCCFAVVTSSE